MAQQETPLTPFVDPFIGTDPNPITKTGYDMDTGNVYPGAVCPHGLLAWSPDTTTNKRIAGGYWYPDSKIEDFSLTHFSGRGVPCLKDIAFEPLVQPVEASPGRDWTRYSSSFTHQNESASPGYYKVKFDNGIITELTASPRSGVAHFTFPPKTASTLLIRANGLIEVNGKEVSGHARKLYFFAQFSNPFTSVKTWEADKISDATSARGGSCGAILSFDTSKDPMIQVRVGISYTSVENARDNLNQENKDGDFAAVQKNAVALWDHELKRIQVEGGTKAGKTVFYTALYHCFIHPSFLDDVNGQYLGMDEKVHEVAKGHHQYQNIPAWDEYRSQSPLMAFLAPKEASDIVQSLVNYAQQDATVRPEGGGLPRWEQMNINSGGMVGDGDDVIIAASYAFGAREFDTKGAWEAMDKGASRPGTTSDGHLVRAGLEEYMSKGYIPESASDRGGSHSASITLEYCNDDFALAQYAESLGHHDKYVTYQNRAQNWKNLFNADTGYIQPRMADGAWMQNFSPSSEKAFTEGTGAQYLWLVNFNLHGLIEKLGGNEKAVERLDNFFTKTNAGPRSEFAFMGNEPCEETPWVYDFAAAPARTQQVVRQIQTELFTSKPSGIPGNDDAGALSSWYVFSALGLYPQIPGVAGFVVGSPIFDKATIHLENGSDIQIIGEHASLTNSYVQTLKVNGHDWKGPWIPWSELSKGGIINVSLGDKPSTWGSDPSVAPPSFDTVKP